MITPEYAFDTCWELYQRIHSEQQAIVILDVSYATGAGGGQQWRPVNVAEGKDYAADFALAGKAALENGAAASRLVLFEVYYVGCAEYAAARERIDISERAWEQWSNEVRAKVGKELMRRGVFPPSKYFGQRTRPRRTAK